MYSETVWWSASRNRECLLPGGQKSGRLRPRLRHRPFDDPQRPGSPVRGPAALHRRAPGGLERWRHGHRQREGQLLAGLRSRRAASGHRNPHCDLRHLGRPADPLRPARRAPVRASAEPGAAVLRPPLLHISWRLRHLPVQFRARYRRAARFGRSRPCTPSWFSIEACMVCVLCAGFARRSDRAGIAAAARRGYRCSGWLGQSRLCRVHEVRDRRR